MKHSQTNECRQWSTAYRVVAVVVLGLLWLSYTQAEVNSKERMRAFAKLPDWSGLWEQYNFGVNGEPATPEDGQRAAADMTEAPPYNPEWQAKYETMLQDRRRRPDDKIICTWGFPGLMVMSPYMFQVMITPEQTALIFNGRETRHIYTDGSPHPETLWATPWGDSIGHWEGQTLVADTVSASPSLLRGILVEGGLDTLWAPLSEQAHFIERIRMIDQDTLEDQMVIEDPVAFKHPWKLTRQFHRVRNMTRLIDEDCQGNDRISVVNGKFTITPP